MQHWFAGSAAASTTAIKADLAPFKTDLSKCALALAIAALRAPEREFEVRDRGAGPGVGVADRTADRPGAGPHGVLGRGAPARLGASAAGEQGRALMAMRCKMTLRSVTHEIGTVSEIIDGQVEKKPGIVRSLEA